MAQPYANFSGNSEDDAAVESRQPLTSWRDNRTAVIKRQMKPRFTKRPDTVGEPCFAVIWTALVAQEGASNAMVRAHAGAAAVVVQLGHLAIQLGFANSTDRFLLLPPTRAETP